VRTERGQGLLALTGVRDELSPGLSNN
jgi:hypothetical protein